jgi:type I site-specific restriction endonuclease
LDKKQLSEIDICEKFISPAIVRAGWSIHDQVFREYPLRVGRVTVRGNKSHRDQSTVLRADYALFYKSNIPIAVVEVKDNNKSISATPIPLPSYAEQSRIVNRVNELRRACSELRTSIMASAALAEKASLSLITQGS